MKYVNVPLPHPIIQRIDKVVQDESNDYRSRPDFILHHIRQVLAQLGDENEK